MNILFVIPPPDVYLSMNLGVSILSQIAKEAGHNVEVIDMNIDLYHNGEINKYVWCRDLNFYWENKQVIDFIWDSTAEELLEKAINNLPFNKIDLVCIRLTDLSYLMATKIAQKFDGIKVIGGGPYTWIRNEKLDGFLEILSGYAEKRFSEIIGATKYSGTYNYKYLEDYTYIWKDTFPIETSRGCIHSCVFCCERKFCNFHIFPYDILEHNIKDISNSRKYNHLYFVDSLLNPNLKHFNVVLDLVEKYKCKLSCNITPITLDANSINRLKILGNRIFVGIETFSEEYAKKLHKPGKRSAILKNLDLIRKYELKIETGIIISGSPFQTEKDLYNDIKMLKEYSDIFSNVVLSPLRVFDLSDINTTTLTVKSPLNWWQKYKSEFSRRLENLLYFTKELESAGIRTEVSYEGTKKFIQNAMS